MNISAESLKTVTWIFRLSFMNALRSKTGTGSALLGGSSAFTIVSIFPNQLQHEMTNRDKTVGCVPIRAASPFMPTSQ